MSTPQWTIRGKCCKKCRLNITIPSYQYRDSHVKDKTVLPTVLSLTWESSYQGRRSLYWDGAQTHIGGHQVHGKVFCGGQFEDELLFLSSGETWCHRRSCLLEQFRTCLISHGEICGGNVDESSLLLSLFCSPNSCMVCRGGYINSVCAADGECIATERTKECWNRKENFY